MLLKNAVAVHCLPCESFLFHLGPQFSACPASLFCSAWARSSLPALRVSFVPLGSAGYCLLCEPLLFHLGPQNELQHSVPFLLLSGAPLSLDVVVVEKTETETLFMENNKK